MRLKNYYKGVIEMQKVHQNVRIPEHQIEVAYALWSCIVSYVFTNWFILQPRFLKKIKS